MTLGRCSTKLVLPCHLHAICVGMALVSARVIEDGLPCWEIRRPRAADAWLDEEMNDPTAGPMPDAENPRGA